MIWSLSYWLLILGFPNLVYYKYFKLKMEQTYLKSVHCFKYANKRVLDCNIHFCHISFRHSLPWWICYSCLLLYTINAYWW